jgi:hypothetical protein
LANNTQKSISLNTFLMPPHLGLDLLRYSVISVNPS